MDFVTVGTILALVISITSHEAAHAWVADKLGDPTARQLGRVTLNPLPHIDPFMTILLPAILYMSGGVLFGGAKPVPVAVHRLRRPARDFALVALAGPGMNLVLALVFAVLLTVLSHIGRFDDPEKIARVVFGPIPEGFLVASAWWRHSLEPGSAILLQATFLNVLLAVFNLVPVPPLDGSRVVMYGLSRLGARQALASYVQLERFGMMILIALFLFVPGFWVVLWGIVSPVFESVLLVVGLT
ncbi:MAG: site-2 protease family protein [Planctomycetes bacterium]|nr:site-2 protease family protein [Planctomycetota bacterium]MBL7008741.1 site-2 protease family protein [Planctomycetota bacterium]